MPGAATTNLRISADASRSPARCRHQASYPGRVRSCSGWHAPGWPIVRPPVPGCRPRCAGISPGRPIRRTLSHRLRRSGRVWPCQLARRTHRSRLPPYVAAHVSHRTAYLTEPLAAWMASVARMRCPGATDQVGAHSAVVGGGDTPPYWCGVVTAGGRPGLPRTSSSSRSRSTQKSGRPV